MNRKGFSYFETIVTFVLLVIFIGLIFAGLNHLFPDGYPEYLAPEERMAAAMEEANRLKAEELKLLRNKQPAEKP